MNTNEFRSEHYSFVYNFWFISDPTTVAAINGKKKQFKGEKHSKVWRLILHLNTSSFLASKKKTKTFGPVPAYFFCSMTWSFLCVPVEVFSQLCFLYFCFSKWLGSKPWQPASWWLNNTSWWRITWFGVKVHVDPCSYMKREKLWWKCHGPGIRSSGVLCLSVSSTPPPLWSWSLTTHAVKELGGLLLTKPKWCCGGESRTGCVALRSALRITPLKQQL